MVFEALASGSSGNAYVVRDGPRALLLEAGLAPKALREALRYRVTTLDACVVTHEHADHSRGVTGVLAAGVSTYMTPGTSTALHLTDHHRVQTLKPLIPTGLRGGWVVLPFRAVHDAAEPINLLVARGSDKLLYVSDTMYCPYRFRGLTLIAVEANHSLGLLRRGSENGGIPAARRARVQQNHMSIERAIALLKANDLTRVREIWLLHLSDTNSNEVGFVKAVRRATGLPVRVAERAPQWLAMTPRGRNA